MCIWIIVFEWLVSSYYDNTFLPSPTIQLFTTIRTRILSFLIPFTSILTTFSSTAVSIPTWYPSIQVVLSYPTSYLNTDSKSPLLMILFINDNRSVWYVIIIFIRHFTMVHDSSIHPYSPSFSSTIPVIPVILLHYLQFHFSILLFGIVFVEIVTLYHSQSCRSEWFY